MKTFLLAITLLISLFLQGQEVIKTCVVKYKCTIQEKPMPGSGILKIEKGEKVDILGVSGSYYQVNYNGTIGYLNDLYIHDPELDQLIKQKEERKKAEKEAELKLIEEQKRIEAEEEARKKAEKAEQELIIEKARLEKMLKEAKKQEEQRRQNLVKTFGKQKASLILEGVVRIGWSKYAAQESWGRPNDINKTTTSSGVREQWVYREKNYKNKYLYFENGILTTIQE